MAPKGRQSNNKPNEASFKEKVALIYGINEAQFPNKNPNKKNPAAVARQSDFEKKILR